MFHLYLALSDVLAIMIWKTSIAT